MWKAVLVLCISTVVAGQESCERSGVVFVWWDRLGVWYVRYDASPCSGHDTSHYICENSSWGNEEATVVCREQGFMYGLGSYVKVETYQGGYHHIECQGTEGALRECDIGDVTSDECSYVAVVSECSNSTPVYVSGLDHSATFPYHKVVQESTEQSGQLCIVAAGPLTERLFIQVTTQPAAHGSIYPSAIAGIDYCPLNQTIIFEATDTMGSEHCLNLEIIDDSLAEDREMFTVLLSTNSSAVHLVNTQVDVYIHPNNVAPRSSPNITSSLCFAVSFPSVFHPSLTYLVNSVFTSPFGPRTSSSSVTVSSMISASHHPKAASPKSGGLLVAGVMVPVAIVLLLLTIAIIAAMIIWLRRKTRTVNRSLNLQPRPSLSLEKDETEEEKRVSLTNPTYQPMAFRLVQRPPGTPEHKFMNPLYVPVETRGSSEVSPSDRQHSHADYEIIEYT